MPGIGISTTKRAKIRPPAKRGGGNVKITDEQAIVILVEKLRGETYEALSAKHNVGEGTIAQWYAGTNRPHLIDTARAIVEGSKA